MFTISLSITLSRTEDALVAVACHRNHVKRFQTASLDGLIAVLKAETQATTNHHHLHMEEIEWRVINTVPFLDIGAIAKHVRTTVKVVAQSTL